MVATMPAQEVKYDFRRMCHEQFVRECRESVAEAASGRGEPTTVSGLMAAFDKDAAACSG